MKYSNIFLVVAILGLTMLMAVKLLDDTSERTSRFVGACADYSLGRVKQTCEDLGIESFKQRRPALEKKFTDYCSCLAGVWRASGIKLRPEFFVDARLPESRRSPETTRILGWSRAPEIRSEYARCHNRSGIDLNWIAAAQLEKKNPRPVAPQSPRRGR